MLTANGLKPASVVFEEGHILSVDAYDSTTIEGASLSDVGDLYVLPGLVDTHVHVNEPGRAHWEGFLTATNAAAGGGCTCIVDMPLNSIPATTTVEALRSKRAAAQGKCLIDYAFWGGVVPGNAHELFALAKAGVRGFKCFLADSGVEEFTRVNETDMDLAMPIIAKTGLPLLVHAELPEPLITAQHQLRNSAADWTLHDTHLRSRPPQAEVEAVKLMIRLCRKHRCRVHIVHVSSAEVLRYLQEARSEGLPITAETCPHYPHFAAEEIPARATQLKCAPPIREANNRELLWQGLAGETLDLIATDHSPCPPELKQLETGEFSSAWGGIASLSIALPVIWTQARKRGFEIADVCRWMCEQPACLAGLESRKGHLAAGHDADFVVFDPEARFAVTPDRLHFRHPVSPYIGEELYGEVRQVFLRGRPIFDSGQFASERLGREMGARTAD